MSQSAKQQTDLGFLLHKFFVYHLLQQRRLSNNTICAYRDTFKLYLSFLSERAKSPVAKLTMNDIDAASVIDFLQYLEMNRNNSVRTRNHRLAAIRTFLNYASSESPTHLPPITKILAIPQKRWNRPLLGHLERDEIETLINSADTHTWSGE